VNRLRWLLGRRGGELALWLGGLLLAVALALQAFVVGPLEQRVDALLVDRKGPRAGALDRLGDELARSESPGAQLASFYEHFARGERLADRLARVYAIAHSLNVEMTHADYRLTSQPDRKIDRYQMILPVHGSYPTVRAFITASLRAMPMMSLDQVQFERKNVGDGAVDAQITFTFHLAR
jgi:hypothetical protein